MRGIKLGQYIGGDSFIHRLDPRTKIISCLIMVMSTLFYDRWLSILFNMIMLGAAVRLSRIKLAGILRGLRKLSLVLVLAFICQVLLTTGKPLFHLGGVQVSRAGITLAISTLLRLVIMYLCSSLLTMTTSPVKLTAGVEALFAPCSRVGIPVHQFAIIIAAALRFIPTILEEAETITKAQQSRGAPFHAPNIITRVKSITAVLIPLLAASLQRANDLAMAMESRCYVGSPSRSRMHSLCLKKQDKLVLGIVCSAFFLSVLPFKYF